MYTAGQDTIFRKTYDSDMAFSETVKFLKSTKNNDWNIVNVDKDNKVISLKNRNNGFSYTLSIPEIKTASVGRIVEPTNRFYSLAGFILKLDENSDITNYSLDDFNKDYEAIYYDASHFKGASAKFFTYGLIAFTVLGLAFILFVATSTCSKSSDEPTPSEKKEFAEKVVTPGTDENKWAHDYADEQRKKNGV